MPVSRTSRFSTAGDDDEISSYSSFRPKSASQSLTNLSSVGRSSTFSSKPDLASRIAKSRDDALVQGLNNRVRTLEASLTKPLESEAFGRIASRRALARRLARGAPRWEDPVAEDTTEATYLPKQTPKHRDYPSIQLQGSEAKRRELLVDEFLNSRKNVTQPTVFESARQIEPVGEGSLYYRSQRSRNLDELEDCSNPGLSRGILAQIRRGASMSQGASARSDLHAFNDVISNLALPHCTERGGDEDYWTRLAQSRGELGQLEQLVSHTFNRRLDEDDINGRRPLVYMDAYQDIGRAPELDLFPTAALAVRWAQSKLNSRID